MENQNNIINQVPRVSGILDIVRTIGSVIMGVVFLVNLILTNISNDKRLTKLEDTQALTSTQVTSSITELKTEVVRLRTIMEETKENKAR